MPIKNKDEQIFEEKEGFILGPLMQYLYDKQWDTVKHYHDDGVPRYPIEFCDETNHQAIGWLIGVHETQYKDRLILTAYIRCPSNGRDYTLQKIIDKQLPTGVDWDRVLCNYTLK
jgi:hypothetical protein